MNAKNELLKVIEDKAEIKCAMLWDNVYEQNSAWHDHMYILPANYNGEKYHTFFKSIDFDYEDEKPPQKIFGYVWLSDGSWLSRNNADQWDWNQCPKIPNECNL